MQLHELKKQYEYYCNEYINKFIKKQNIEFDGWILNEVGGTACFNGEFSLNFSDILLDINTKQKKGLILKWHYDFIENTPQNINYKSYTMGLRFEDI